MTRRGDEDYRISVGIIDDGGLIFYEEPEASFPYNCQKECKKKTDCLQWDWQVFKLENDLIVAA